MLLDTEEVIAQGFLGIIEHFRWRRVSIIVQDEKIFTAVGDVCVCVCVCVCMCVCVCVCVCMYVCVHLKI